ncbi:MAG: S66 peptidase family protein [Bacteroidota bacterium]
MEMLIPYLQPGDLIKIVAPAKGIEPSLVFEAREFLQTQGFQVELGQFCVGKFNYFSGTDAERKSDFQDALDNPEVKAIICARGGYGCVRITDLLNWASFIRNPKWIVGFSDVTVFHQRIQKFGFESIHATMPLNYKTNTAESLQTMVDAMSGKLKEISVPGQAQNIPGEAQGKLMGGNLSILYSLIGTDDQPDYNGSILFVEDLAEQLYHIDRMFYSLQKSGIIHQINGLVVGGFTDLKDTENPFGKSYREIILDHCSYRNIPIAFEFPAGHIDDNRALIFGREVSLVVSANETSITF